MAKKKAKKRAPDAGTTREPPAAPLDAATLQQAMELQTQELEVLQAIYDQDLQLKSSTPVYTHIFSIRVHCESVDTPGATVEVVLHFDWSKAYPLRQPAQIQVELHHGLSDADIQKLNTALQKRADEKVGDVMVYDLVVEATEYIEEHLKSTSSFFDEMIQRQHDRETELKREEEQLQQLEVDEALAKNQEILAMIDAQRKKKQEDMKQRRRVRRRRRHRSSIDMRDDYGSGGDSAGDDDDDEDDELGSDVLSGIYERQHSLDDGGGDDSDRSSRSESSSSSDHDSMDVEHRHSRYHGDFKELGLLGRGGGGEVVKVRNRLDRQLYAVKKIKLDPEDPTMKKKILREVKTISRMQHRHIVRYFQAWIEGESGYSSEDIDSSEESSSDDEDVEEEEDISHIASGSSATNDDDVGMKSPISTGDEDDDWLGTMSNSIGMWSTSKHDSRRSNPFQLSSYQPSLTMEDDGFEWESLEEEPMGGSYSADEARYRKPRAPIPREKRKSERLYIQMEYCEGKALREVIDKGSLWKEPDKIWTLFRQILEAIAYIHGQGIIHRDIKPPNIFLDAEGTVKLGDFGLAVRPPRAIEEEDDDGDDGNDGSATATAFTGAYLSESSGASAAADLYGKLKLENLETTRGIAPSFDPMTSTTMSALANESITAGVGTAFYRAPEQEKQGQRYNQKADMFSLGILFSEMWSPPYTTLMERAQALTGLREKHVLPTQLNVPENVKEIILALCQPNPAARPNAADLLKSPLLPAKMEVEGAYLSEVLQTLANPEGKFFGQLIDTLLTKEPVSHIDYTYENVESVKMRSYMVELRAKTYVKATLQKVFERHGAVEHTTPLLMPRTAEQNYTGITLSMPHSACTLLDGAGVSVSLPFDLTERLARFVARHNITRLKCFQFERVYRKNVVGGHPRELLESDFDIIWDDRGSCRFLELEGLEVVAEVIQALSTSLGSYYLRLNDARITRCIMEMYNVPAVVRRDILRLFSNEMSLRVHAGQPSTVAPTFKPGRWRYVVKKLKEHGAPQEIVDSLKPFFLMPEDCVVSLEIVENELQKQFTKNLTKIKGLASEPSVSTDRKKQLQKRETQLRRLLKDGNEGIAALRNLLQGIEFLRLSGPACARIDLGLSPRPERYTSGFIFQAVLLLHGNSLPTSASALKSATNTQVIAEGGRYDTLITRFKLPAAYVKASSVAAMGVRFSIDKIVSCVIGAISPLVAEPKASCMDLLTGGRKILICSAGKASDMTLHRMQIALMLWSHGIGADYLHPDPMHLEDLEDYCMQQSIQWMVIVQKHLMREKKQIKVRSVKNPSEADSVVSCSSLVEFILDLFGRGGAHSDSAGGRGPHSHDSDPYSSAMGSGSHQRGGRDGAAGASSFQPVLDVVVLDGKHPVYKDGKNKNSQMDTHKITRRVSKWITSSFASRGEEAMKVLSVDLPFSLLRELSSALMEHGAGGVDIICGDYPRYRKQVKYAADELLSLEPTGSSHVARERYVLLHSIVDDRYDLMSLTQSSKSGRKNFSFKRSP